MIRFTQAKMIQKAKPRSAGNKNATLNKLRAFLNASEPEAVEFLVSFWNTQAQGVTYAELREAYLAGEITPQLYQKWTQDYSRFIQDKLTPLWQQAADIAAAEVAAQYPQFLYEPSISAAAGFIKAHGAELVTNITEEQRRALNAVIAHVSGYTAVTPDEAARIIRPTVGLTVPQTLANIRHREAVEQAYLKAHPKCNPKTAKRKAAESAARYAGRQHRYRAQNIARTELAFAYNAGAYGATKDAQMRGYIGDCVKVWLTAYDERVCPICAAMDDERRNIDEAFSNGKLLPPGHPSCRCAVAYEEIGPPVWRTEAKMNADSRDLQSELGESILLEEPLLGKEGDTDGYTTITKVEPFDFSDTHAVAQKLSEFTKAYRTAKTEYAQILSPQNLAFLLAGTSISVNTRLAGKAAVHGSIEIHNHPPNEDGFADAFSRDDFRELFWGQPAEAWLVAGEHIYRMSYTGLPITPEEAVEKYKEALQAIRQRAMETGIPIESEQLEIMQWLNETMKGLKFDELQ